MNDKIIIQPSGRFVMIRMLTVLFSVESIFALIIIAYLFYGPSQTADRSFIVLLWFLQTIKFLILAAFMADVIIRFLGVRYFMSKHHLIVSRGIINDEEKVLELKHVRKITVVQDGMGKAFGYGSVNLVLGDKGYEEKISLPNIANPRKVAGEIESYLGLEQARTSQLN